MSDDLIQSLLAAIERVESGQTRLRVDLMSRMDRLQHTLDQVKDDIVVNYAAGDRVERIAQSASDEGRSLAVIVRAMQQQIARLQTDVEALRGPSS